MYAETEMLLPYLQGFSQEVHQQQHPLQEELLYRLQSGNGPLLFHDNAGCNMVLNTTVTDYDLGIDLFEAPEPIIYPVIELDPMTSAISAMPDCDAVLDPEVMKIADFDPIPSEQFLSEVFYKGEKDILENSMIEDAFSKELPTIEEALYDLDIKIPVLENDEETIINNGEGVQDKEVQNSVISGYVTSLEDELSDIKIPALQNEEKTVQLDAKAGDETLQKSTSSSSLTTLDWINGGYVKPNFLDFQGVDLSAVFGMRRAYSEGDIQNLGDVSMGHVNANIILPPFERLLTIDDYKAEERRQKLSRYRKKKTKRNFDRKIKYACRKALADSQPRVRGRFAKCDECEVAKASK